VIALGLLGLSNSAIVLGLLTLILMVPSIPPALLAYRLRDQQERAAFLDEMRRGEPNPCTDDEPRP
jgi:hypothetical protein